MPSGSIRAIDMELIDALFGMGAGYVLDFSDRTFAEFFTSELGLNIYDPRYSIEGTSKAKRLRYFLRTSEPHVVVQTLVALWEYRETKRRRTGAAEQFPDAKNEFDSLVERLGGKRPASQEPARATQADLKVDPARAKILSDSLIRISHLAPQERGYAYEHFLKDLFDANGLAARASFRLVGEQIDGSFELSSETYLLEAKWTGPAVGVAELRSFNAKVEDKAAWSRGLFVSHSGFTPEGLSAFGRGKRVVCMDGLDLYEMLTKEMPFADVLAKKVRRAAESGEPFVRVRDLH